MATWKNLNRLSDELTELVAFVRTSTVMILGRSADLAVSGSGSGWVFDRSGHIVTNHHVVEDLTGSIKVKQPDRPEVSAELVGVDAESDLAVLSVPGLSATPLSIRQQPPRLGELCLALGAPLGLPETASVGIVSGIGRQLPHPNGFTVEEMLQTDASINPGNSGGPLVDSHGQLIGVNTMGRNDGQNIGFAVSAEMVVDVVPEIIRYGAVHRATLGVSVAHSWVHDGKQDVTAISVRRVSRPDSQFRPGDLLVQIGSTLVTRRYDVRKALGRDVVGRPIQVWVKREGKVVELNVTAEPR